MLISLYISRRLVILGWRLAINKGCSYNGISQVPLLPYVLLFSKFYLLSFLFLRPKVVHASELGYLKLTY